MAIRTPLLNYYEILGLPRDAGLREIEAAYRARVVASRDLPNGLDETRRINLAYRALSDPDRRRDYDTALGGTAASSIGGAGAAGAFLQRPSEADAVVNEQPEAEADFPPEQMDDEEPASEPSTARRMALLALFAGLTLLAVLFAGSWLQRDEPQVAAREPTVPGQASVPGATATRPTTAENDRGWLEETLDEVASLGQAPQQAAVAAAEAPPVGGTDSPAVVTSTEQAGGNAAVPEEGTELAVVEPPEEAAPAQSAEPSPQPEPPAAPAASRPAPAPAPDRSAPARLLAGGLYNSDNPGGRFSGSVGVRLQIGSSGRVQGCQVSRSSGDGNLDATTCRLLSQRLQFAPAQDRNGVPTAVTVDGSHVWGRRERR